jgi:hypothetical protein
VLLARLRADATAAVRRGHRRRVARYGNISPHRPPRCGCATAHQDGYPSRSAVARRPTLMKSWLRRVAGLLSSRPDPRQSTPDDWRPEDFTPVPETAAAPDPWAGDTPQPPMSSSPQPPPAAATTPHSVQPIQVRRDDDTAAPVEPVPRVPEQLDLGTSTELLPPSSSAAEEPPRRSAAAPPDPAWEGLAPAPLPNPSTEPEAQPTDTAPESPVPRPTPTSDDAEAVRPITIGNGDWGEDSFATATWPVPDAEQLPDPRADAGTRPAYAEPDAFDAVPSSIDLPDYDPTLNQRLGSEDWAVFDPSRARATEKAARIAALLDVTTRHEMNAAVAWLEALFLEHPRPSTFLALERAALEGLDFATLRDMAALRGLWAQHPEWWVCRIPSHHARNGATGISLLANGTTALSWAQARRICQARADYPVAEMIDPDWLTEWYRLRPEAGSPISFLSFIEEKIAAETSRQIHAGLDALHRAGDLVERWDRHDWARDLYDPSDGMPLCLSMADVIGPRAHGGPDAE